MLPIHKPPAYDKVLLIHNGAVGDFFILWPALWAISQAFSQAELLWAGSSERLAWLAPLGFTACTPAWRKALTDWHVAKNIPAELSCCLIIWPVLETPPPVPPAPNLWVLPGLGRPGFASCGQTYLDGLRAKGLAVGEGWAEAFQRLFAGNRQAGNVVLLFPGAGHFAKTWPLVKFFALAEKLRAMGLEPRFVLGPAELEGNLDVAPWKSLAPDSLSGLQELILAAKAVVGGDTGPMHLAAMLGVPGLCLFGPTSPGQWGPAGMRTLGLGLDCSPCTRTCSDLTCPEPRCLGELPVEMVLKALGLILENKIGFQEPGFLESRLCQKEEGRTGSSKERAKDSS